MPSLEKNKEIATITKSYFKQLGTRNIRVFDGPISNTLPQTLETISSLEYVFFNQLLEKEEAIQYFEQCLKKILPNSIVVLKSPYFSKDSMAFWEYLKQHKGVKLSIDLFNLGFIFFRSEQLEVVHYKLIESWKKPWALF